MPPTATPAPIHVDRLIEHSRLTPFQVTLLLLCGLCLIIDGFDAQAMGYVAPAIIGEWHVGKAALGPVFGPACWACCWAPCC
ncbi:hypothetical protein [Pseudoduganella armeniaca]|uniref:hypothetical protein n=1 Tax=Pseudoduganella armeniaca TaxID=2072590 RepID=UPI0026A91C58